jgi:CubicO group peptidase (beta-lactamase class C family)
MKQMLLWLFLVFPCAAQQAHPATDADESAIKQVVDTYMQPLLQRTGAPGAIVGVSLHGRRYFFPYGQARDDGTPFTPNTLVEIGSCTKVFTTTLFALAIGRNQMVATAPAQQYMPKGFSLRPAARQMTPLELADFTSGMPDDPPNLPERLEMRSIEHYTIHDFLTWVSKRNPDTPPPAPYLYSNAGIGLLSFLIETATNQRWQPQLNQEILSRLGMTDTELRPSPTQMERMAEGHQPNGAPAPPWPIYAWFAAGGLRSTATDMLRFGEANLGHRQVDGNVVPQELIAAMKAAQAPIYTLPNEINQQGMAWVSNLGDGEPQLHPEIVKNGGTAGFATAIMLNHAKDLAIFVGINQQPAGAAEAAIAIGRHLP